MLIKNRSLFLLLSILLCFLQFACSQKRLAPIDYQETILAFGDSLTFGYGTTTDKAYPAILAKLTNRTVINAGISGETSQAGLARFAQVLDTHQPTLVILLEGGNDILRNMSLAQTKANLSEMIKLAQSKGVQIILLDVPEKKFFSEGASLYQELAVQHDIVLIQGLISDLLKSPSLKSDPIHLNAQGYTRMAEEIYTQLRKHGAL